MLISKGLTGDVRMRRREFLAVLGGAAAWPLATRAQQAERIYRIGVLAPEVPPPGLLETFQDELRALGYVEGKNVAIESRHAGGKNERLATLADELVRLGMDIILAVNTQAAQAAKKATATIPIVITRVTDPVKTGLVDSFARPGGNITGMSNMLEAINAKRLQLLKEILPGLAHVAVLWDIGNPGATVVVDDMETVSARLGLDMLRVPVHGPADFPGAFDVAVRGRAQALIIFDDALITKHRVELLDLAMRHTLPIVSLDAAHAAIVSLYKPTAEAGALITYGPNTPAMYRRAAYYVDRILKGAKPGDLPIEQPTKFDLFINGKTAKALGLTIPESLLALADEVIQ